MTDEELTIWEKMNVFDLQRIFGIDYALANRLYAFIAEALRKARKEERDRVYKLVGELNTEDRLNEYKFRGDNGDYVPSEKEKLLMVDYCEGELGELQEAIRRLQ